MVTGPLSEDQKKAIVESVVLDGDVDLSKSPCMGKPDTVDARGPLRLAGNQTGGLNVGNGINAPVGGCLVGAAVRARWSRDLDWDASGHAGDGVVWGAGAGTTTVHGAYIDNFADALAPPKSPTTSRASRWVVKNVYVRYNRDDLVENDACLNGEMHDSLIDGTHMGMSVRPGRGNTVSTGSTPVLKITNTMMRLDCKPDTRDGDEFGGSCGDGASLSQFWKWTAACSPPPVLDLKDVILRMDDVSRNGPGAMAFPPGTYENVYIIYLGEGAYPGKLPEKGVVLQTKDTSLWDMARAKWMARHGCDEKGDHCTMTDK